MVYVLLIVVGLCLGSFVNALVFRLHEQSKQQSAASRQRKAKKLTANSQQLTAKDLSILKGRSMCPHCHHTLATSDLVPVISWIALKGRCRYCKKPISVQYPIVELVTAGLFVFSYIFWPLNFEPWGIVLFGLWLISLTLGMAMVVYDLKWMMLPDKLTYPFIGLSVMQVIVLAFLQADAQVVIGAVAGLAIIGGLFYVLFQVSDGRWIGGGDVKLGFGLGLLAGGAMEGLLLIFLASLLGSLISVPLLATKKIGLKRQIPFGPFLILAGIVTYLFGADIITWYQTHFLFS